MQTSNYIYLLSNQSTYCCYQQIFCRFFYYKITYIIKNIFMAFQEKVCKESSSQFSTTQFCGIHLGTSVQDLCPGMIIIFFLNINHHAVKHYKQGYNTTSIDDKLKKHNNIVYNWNLINETVLCRLSVMLILHCLMCWMNWESVSLEKK